MSLSHVNESNQAAMVDVSEKADTIRIATAEARVTVNDAVASQFDGRDFVSKKGPVFQTAILAGTMGAKQTSALIPLCHPLPLHSCKFDVSFQSGEAVIRCTCKTSGKTGIEMEALTGATVAALAFYDMCKALDPAMVIHGVRLLEKTGGKSDYTAARS